MDCIVSVVIPTFGRPELLHRAILSCLAGVYADHTEVIVVPNGESVSWKSVQIHYVNDSRVSFYYSPLADQNNARNIGIERARGKLIRFLDDDDYLFPSEADSQYHLMLHSDLDFCSGGVMLTDCNNEFLSSLSQPDTDSPEIATLSKQRLQLPFAHVYRRRSIGSLRWPVGVKQSEDIVWLVRYVAATPRLWQRFEPSVGAWYQHAGYRQSLDRPSGVVHEVVAEVLFEACALLQNQKRWNDQLSSVAAEALWDLTHRAFPFRPAYWSKIGGQVLRLNASARPSAFVYRYPLLRSINPRILMWLFLPKRLISLGFTLVQGALFGRDYKRSL